MYIIPIGIARAYSLVWLPFTESHHDVIKRLKLRMGRQIWWSGNTRDKVFHSCWF